MDFILPIAIAGIASAVGSIATLLLAYLRRRSKSDILILRDESYSLRINRENADFIDAIFSGDDALSSAMEELIARERRAIDIAGISLRGLLEAPIVQALTGALQRNVRVRILLAHPESARLREAQESRTQGAIAREVLHTLETLLQWRDRYCSTSQNLEIRLSRAMLSSFMLITSDRIIVRPYLAAGAYTSPGLVFSLKAGDKRFQEFYASSFSALWDQSTTSETIASDPERTREQLDHLAAFATEKEG